MHKVEIVITGPDGNILERTIMEILGQNHMSIMPLSPFQNVNTKHPNMITIREILESDIGVI